MTLEDKPKITRKMRFEIIREFIRMIIIIVIPGFIISRYFGDGEYLSGKSLIVISIYIIIVVYVEERHDKKGKK